MQQQSRCIYCGSPNIGKGCRYGPHGVHFHPNNSTLCAYCKSPNYGKGCKINPTSDLHIHGLDYNFMFKESVQSHLDSTYLINELKKPFKDFYCYKLGIINEKGDKIKNPVTEQEQSSFDSLTKTIIRLKKFLGNKTCLLDATFAFDKEKSFISENLEKRQARLKYKALFDEHVNNLYKTFEGANKEGLTLEEIKSFFRT